MISLLKSPMGYVVEMENGERLHGDAEMLLGLRLRLNQWADTLRVDGEVDDLVRGILGEEEPLLDTVDAKLLAGELGVELSTSAVNMACRRGSLRAEKDGGRWKFQRVDFEHWLKRFQRRAG